LFAIVRNTFSKNGQNPYLGAIITVGREAKRALQRTKGLIGESYGTIRRG